MEETKQGSKYGIIKCIACVLIGVVIGYLATLGQFSKLVDKKDSKVKEQEEDKEKEKDVEEEDTEEDTEEEDTEKETEEE